MNSTFIAFVALFFIGAASASEFELSSTKPKIEGGPVDVHVLRAKTISVEDWQSLPLNEGYPGEGQTLTELANQGGAKSSVNANFYREDKPGEQEPLGLVIHKGEVMSFPSRYYPSAGFVNGKFEWDIVSLQAIVEAEVGGKKVRQKLCRLNGRASMGCASLWLKKAPSNLKNVIALKKENAWGLSTGKKTYVLSSAEDAAAVQALTLQWPSAIDQSQVKSVVIEVHLRGSRLGAAWQNVKEAVSGSHILSDKKIHPPLTRSWAIAKQPRSIIGADQDGKPFIAVFDGRRDDSQGISVRGAWDYLKKNFNAAWALNLDGGGSTTLIHDGAIINRPSDRLPRDIAVGWGSK